MVNMMRVILISYRNMMRVILISYRNMIESHLDIVQEHDVLDRDGDKGMQMGGGMDDDSHGADEGMPLNVQDIDAYWLQRKISQAYDQQMESQQSHTCAEEILKILELDNDHEVETKLLVHLQFDKSSLIKYLLRNRLKIVWCTRLARAEDQEKRKQIEGDMMQLGPDLVAILEKLNATRKTTKERQLHLENSIQEEAKRLKDESGGVQMGIADMETENGWLYDQRQILDLESIASHQNGLLMANTKCELPARSYRKQKNGYEEVYLPALELKPLAADEKLVLIKNMPHWAKPAFEGMTELTRVQSRVYETALFKADNILLSAPTGAGKITVAMLTILHQIGLHMEGDGSFNHGDYKIVYVAPTKALVAEVVGILSSRLKHYGVTVIKLSGDQYTTPEQIEEAHLIVTTPEKWDKITRKSGNLTFTHLKLLIIDELHALNDERGPVLESIVARTVRQVETRKEQIRLVGLSATLPNYDDVASFLQVDLEKGLFHFDNSYRHVPLAQQCIGITVTPLCQRNQLMNEICYEKVIGVAGKYQVLIFVHSRNETTKTAHAIKYAACAKKTIGIFCREDSREILQNNSKRVESKDLEHLLPYGLAIHHAGIKRADRELVEKLFAAGHIQVLFSTTTLSKGVNLPAHTVIIKGTQRYNSKNEWTEFCPLDVMQMLSRAGKPQSNNYSEGIIITGHSELQYYLTLMDQQLPIESRFVSKLVDHMNVEIVLGTIQNAKEAQHWLGYTYLYFCMMKNPTLYSLPADAPETDKMLENWRADPVHSAATDLDKNNLVEYDIKTGNFEVTDLGRIGSKYCITHGTIGTYNEHLNPIMSDIELCRLLSLSEEFKSIPVRENEKEELAKLLDRVQIPIKEGLENPSAKINVLLLAHISQLKPRSFSLTYDMDFITQNAGRLMRALYEIVYEKGWARLAEKALKLCKRFELVQKDEDM